MIKSCVRCKAAIDVTRNASAHCSKHNNEICWPCTHKGKNCGIEEDGCSLCIITNPKWIINILKSNR